VGEEDACCHHNGLWIHCCNQALWLWTCCHAASYLQANRYRQ
jgi:hypothetical protein